MSSPSLPSAPKSSKPYKLPDSGYKISFFLPTGIIDIAYDGTTTMALPPGAALTNSEMAAIALFAQTLAKLRNGKLMDFEISLANFEDGEELIKCEWLPKSGNLKLHGPTDKTYRFTSTVNQALHQRRVFTCFRSLANVLPKSRNRS